MSARSWRRLSTVFCGMAVLFPSISIAFIAASAQQSRSIDRFAVQYPGTNASEKIKACIADLPSGGGTCDATGLQGAQSIESDFTSDLTRPGTQPKPVTLLLGHTTITCSRKRTANCIQLPSGFRMIGLGNDQTIIRFDDEFPAWVRLIVTAPHASHIEISGLTLDGNISHYGGDRKIRQNHGIMLMQAKDVSVHDNHFHDFWGDALMLWGTADPSSDVKVFRNLFKGNSRADISFISAEQVDIYSNNINKATNFGSIHGEPDVEEQIERDIRVHDNILTGGGISFTAQRYKGEGDNPNVQRISVINNTVNDSFILMQRTPFCRVIGNKVLDAGNADAGIVISTHSCVIESNQVSWSQQPCPLCAGIYVAGSAIWEPQNWWGKGENRIAKNSITNARGAAIVLYDSSDNLVDHNTVISVLPRGQAPAVGINIGGSGSKSLRNVVTNNVITDPKPNPTTTFGLSSGPGENPLVGNNTFKGVTSRGISNPNLVKQYSPERLKEILQENPNHAAATNSP
jgi:parallel beta-helix repeat protein